MNRLLFNSYGIFTGGQQHSIATILGSGDAAVIWRVQESGGGAIDANGLYAAPAVPGTYHVIATSHAHPTKTATVAIAVAPHPIAVSVSPTNTGTIPNGTIQFTATLTAPLTKPSLAVSRRLLLQLPLAQFRPMACTKHPTASPTE
jgi:hypothetical protein